MKQLCPLCELWLVKIFYSEGLFMFICARCEITASKAEFESKALEREGSDNFRLLERANAPVNQAHQMKRREDGEAPINYPSE